MENIDRILEGNGISKDNLEASLEFSRLVSEETGICCAELGRFALTIYHKLEGEEE